MKIFPLVSIVVFAKNEEINIKRCLDSIYNQNYPKDRIEVVFVDDMSTDSTPEIAKSYPVRYFRRESYGNRDANKLFGFSKTKGEIVTYLDADIHVRGREWMNKMVQPLVENKDVTASFTRYYSDSHSKPIEKYLNLDPLQRDVVYQYFSPSPRKVITEETNDYFICEFKLDAIPPQGVCFHRRELIKHNFVKSRFLELDILVELVRNGHTKFAYVPSAGMFHHHANSLLELLMKRMRNVKSVYLVENDTRTYRWFDTSSLDGLMKIFFWIVISHLFFPLLFTGIFKSLKNKTFVGLYEPFVGLLATDVIILSFFSDVRGRKLIVRK